jgi:Na+/proline symporter
VYGLHALDLATLAVYLIGITVAGLWTARSVKGLGDYFMGGRRFGKAMMVMHSFGTGTHTDQAVTVAGACYKLGLAGIWYQWLYLFVTPFYWVIAPLLRRMRYITTADFFEDRFGKSIGLFYAGAGLVKFSLQIGIMLLGTAKTASAITGGAMDETTIIWVMTLLFVTYGVAGGLSAAIVTDFIQGLFIIVLSFLLVPYVLEHVGGFEGLHRLVPAEMFSLTAPGDPPAGYARITPFYISVIVVNALIGTIASPHHMAIGGAGKTEHEVRVGFTYGNLMKRFCTVAWALVGVACVAIYPNLDDPEHAFGMATRDLLPVGLIGIMLASMVAAVMSSCDSYMVDGAAIFVGNIYRPYIRQNKEEAHYLLAGRLASLVVVAGGILTTYLSTSVVGLLVVIWSASAFFGIPAWGGVIWRRCNEYGAWAGSVGAIALWYVSRFEWGWDLGAQFTLYLVGGVVAMVVVSLLTPRPEEARVNRFYTVLHTPVGQEHKLREAGIKVVLE